MNSSPLQNKKKLYLTLLGKFLEKADRPLDKTKFMNKKQIDKLVLVSYKDNFLDQKRVNRIATLLGRSDLKKYINGLKLNEKKKSLIISTPMNNQDLRKFSKLFPNKKIILRKDPNLMLGVKVVDNDIVYEFTLKNSLDKIISHIEQNYD
jgi:hypothetical protein